MNIYVCVHFTKKIQSLFQKKKTKTKRVTLTKAPRGKNLPQCLTFAINNNGEVG